MEADFEIKEIGPFKLFRLNPNKYKEWDHLKFLESWDLEGGDIDALELIRSRYGGRLQRNGITKIVACSLDCLTARPEGLSYRCLKLNSMGTWTFDYQIGDGPKHSWVGCWFVAVPMSLAKKRIVEISRRPLEGFDACDD